MGKRRIRLLKKVKADIKLFGIDLNKKRAQEVQNEYALAGIYDSLNHLIQTVNVDAVIICSSPLTHHEYVLKALENQIPTFSEINLTAEKYDKIITTSDDNHKVAFLSSTFLYRKEIQWIKQNTNPRKSFYRYHVGQYLPDWHPWESYKDFFVKEKRTNGCREIMAIDFPWIVDIFGHVADFKVIRSKKTELELDYPDVYQMLFQHESGASGNITIDLVSRKAERSLQIIREYRQIEWDGTPETLYVYDIANKEMKSVELYAGIKREKGYATNIIEDAYEEELKTFLKSLEKQENLGLYSYEKDKQILTLIDNIEDRQHD